MTAERYINDRDLRLRSREIMDAVERGEAFTVTRDGQPIAELFPLPRGPRFVTRAAFAAASRTVPDIDLDRFERDQDFADDDLDPYA
ncbi:type II toxin-antitoxin system Phd/YefM family antitoxin [Piscicoccus intestinalis]|uniref:type II toxin-antitoxin system Phd/YefM family antitoxin n=1 Tax=Piscicoccus intestinalis TaxID=746033 RepID=UPI000837C715|nr:prevent-host-death protein [Piscicoccus intestinalis]